MLQSSFQRLIEIFGWKQVKQSDLLAPLKVPEWKWSRCHTESIGELSAQRERATGFSRCSAFVMEYGLNHTTFLEWLFRNRDRTLFRVWRADQVPGSRQHGRKAQGSQGPQPRSSAAEMHEAVHAYLEASDVTWRSTWRPKWPIIL